MRGVTSTAVTDVTDDLRQSQFTDNMWCDKTATETEVQTTV